MRSKREYKDSLFRALFKHKEELRVLYNALTGEHLAEASAIVLNDLGGVLHHTPRNDVSFQVGEETIVLIEQQSTVSENLPYRMGIYLWELYRRQATEERLYGHNRRPVPGPRLHVFYWGKENLLPEQELKLSDAFTGNGRDAEIVVHVHNVTAGRGNELLKASPDPLPV